MVIAFFLAVRRSTVSWYSLIHSSFMSPKTCYLLKLSELDSVFIFVAVQAYDPVITQNTYVGIMCISRTFKLRIQAASTLWIP
jgi:hypothetical protein